MKFLKVIKKCSLLDVLKVVKYKERFQGWLGKIPFKGLAEQRIHPDKKEYERGKKKKKKTLLNLFVKESIFAKMLVAYI